MFWIFCNIFVVNCGIVGWDVYVVIERVVKVVKSIVFNFIRFVFVVSC